MSWHPPYWGQHQPRWSPPHRQVPTWNSPPWRMYNSYPTSTWGPMVQPHTWEMILQPTWGPQRTRFSTMPHRHVYPHVYYCMYCQKPGHSIQYCRMKPHKPLPNKEMDFVKSVNDKKKEYKDKKNLKDDKKMKDLEKKDYKVDKNKN